MMFFFSRGERMSDGVVARRRIYYEDPEESLGFGEVRDYRITLAGRRFEIGQVSLRLGEGTGIYYFGHIGYHIDPPWRGHHYAERAVRLLVESSHLGGKESLVITADPDNVPSRKTCLRLGCREERTVRVPEPLQKQWKLSREKVRYILDVPR